MIWLYQVFLNYPRLKSIKPSPFKRKFFVTRLTPDDINTLSNQLADFDEELLLQTGQDMLGFACHGAGISKETIQNSIKGLSETTEKHSDG